MCFASDTGFAPGGAPNRRRSAVVLRSRSSAWPPSTAAHTTSGAIARVAALLLAMRYLPHIRPPRAAFCTSQQTCSSAPVNAHRCRLRTCRPGRPPGRRGTAVRRPGWALHARTGRDRRRGGGLHRRRSRLPDTNEGGPTGGRARARALRGRQRAAAVVRDRRHRRDERRSRRRSRRATDRRRARDRRRTGPRGRRGPPRPSTRVEGRSAG